MIDHYSKRRIDDMWNIESCLVRTPKWARKSVSVRVGPAYGAKISPNNHITFFSS